MQSKIIDKDLGYRRIMGLPKEVDGAAVKIGVQSDEGYRDAVDGEEPILQVVVAAVNEFGSEDGRIPERSFMRSTFDEERTNINAHIDAAWDRILKGESDIRTELGKLGEVHQGKVRQKIIALDTPPNAPATIAKKGSSNPLVNTGDLGGAIRWVYATRDDAR